MVVAANNLTSLQSGHMINGNPVTSSRGACTSIAVGVGAAATIARASGCRPNLAALDRQVRAAEDDACDMRTERGKVSNSQRQQIEWGKGRGTAT